MKKNVVLIVICLNSGNVCYRRYTYKLCLFIPYYNSTRFDMVGYTGLSQELVAEIKALVKRKDELEDELKKVRYNFYFPLCQPTLPFESYLYEHSILTDNVIVSYDLSAWFSILIANVMPNEFIHRLPLPWLLPMPAFTMPGKKEISLMKLVIRLFSISLWR